MFAKTDNAMDDMQQEQAPRASQSRRIQFYDVNANSCASDSVVSTEIAIERGSLRAMKERNDANSLQQSTLTFPFVDINKEHNDEDNDKDEDDDDDFDEHPPYSGINWNLPPNISDDHHDSSKDSVRGRMQSKSSFWLRKFSKFRKKRDSSYSEASDSLPPDLSNMTVRVVSGISNEAWMCGCCGKIFSTLTAADSHEKACIQAVIASHIANYASVSPVVPTKPTPSHMSTLLPPASLAESARSIYKSARSIMPEPNLISSLRPPLLSTVAPDKPRNVSFSEAYDNIHQGGFESMDMMEEENLLMLTNSMKRQVITTDRALIESVLNVASQNLLSPEELDAEYELEHLAKDRQYYITMAQRRSSRQSNPMTKFRTEGKSVASKIQNKLVDAWQLIKEGGDLNHQGTDEYTNHRPNDQSGMGPKELLLHNGHTHYINVVVKHSIHVVNSELERLAQKRWHDAHPSLDNDNTNNSGVENNDTQQEHSPRHVDGGKFEQFRKFAHVKLIKLAKLALAADFTPRKVAVQLSNDLYRYVGIRFLKS
jgi:hypothetical protein